MYFVAADDLVYVEDESMSYHQKIRIDNVYWDSLMKFVEETTCHLVWDLCALSLRTMDNSWDSSNAELLFKHIVTSRQKVFGFQFGNEPGHWYTRHYPNGPTGLQLGKDLQTLKSLVKKYFIDYGPNKPLIFGPDNCGPGDMTDDSPCASVEYFNDIIRDASNVLSGVTIHHYGIIEYSLFHLL